MREALVAIFAAVLLGVVVNGVYTNLKLRRHGGRATAHVVSVRAHQSTGTDENGTRTRVTAYKAVLSFTTEDGQHIMAEERNGGRTPGRARRRLVHRSNVARSFPLMRRFSR
jgi:hypothetical protein